MLLWFKIFRTEGFQHSYSAICSDECFFFVGGEGELECSVVIKAGKIYHGDTNQVVKKVIASGQIRNRRYECMVRKFDVRMHNYEVKIR